MISVLLVPLKNRWHDILTHWCIKYGKDMARFASRLANFGDLVRELISPAEVYVYLQCPRPWFPSHGCMRLCANRYKKTQDRYTDMQQSMVISYGMWLLRHGQAKACEGTFGVNMECQMLSFIQAHSSSYLICICDKL